MASTAAPAGAIGAGSLDGIVTDSGGAAIRGAIVSLERTEGKPLRGERETGDGGEFHFNGLFPADDYRVTVARPGYATVVVPEVSIAAGATSRLRIVLPPSEELEERVAVTARPPRIDLQETRSATRLGSEIIDILPIAGRNYQDILTLAPGVDDADGDGNPNIHGARETNVMTMVDGVSTTDPLSGTVGAQLNIESIAEIEIVTSGAGAEHGRAQGGFVNIFTKSGGNDFEGAFKFVWRGSALDGDGAGFDDPRLHGGRVDAGSGSLSFNDVMPFVSLGGPIARDRAWFFAALESIRLEEPVNTLRQAFLRRTEETRAFGKATWQASPNHRLTFTINHDPQILHNRGIETSTLIESGFTDRLGGTILTARSVSVLSPVAVLETSASLFDQGPARRPTLGPDTDGDGLLWIDRNDNGFVEAAERDVGDLEYSVDRNTGITSGPYFESLSDERSRVTFRQDLNVFRVTPGGSHDLKIGALIEREEFRRAFGARNIVSPFIDRCDVVFCPPGDPEDPDDEMEIPPSTISALIPVRNEGSNEATGLSAGVYVQDNYRPVPNLSLGLGLRFDREAAHASGWSSFDPGVERDVYDRLLLMGGAMPGPLRGIPSDPLFARSHDIREAARFLTDPIVDAALARLSRHHDSITFDAEGLLAKGFLPPGGLEDPSDLLAQGVSIQTPEKVSITNDNIAPRLNVSWDPWSTGRTKIFSSWGRYYDKLFLSTIVGEQGPDRVNRYYFLDLDGVTDTGDSNHGIGRLIARAPPSATQVDRGLSTPFSDEWTIGVEREVAPEVALRITFIDRKFRRQLQDVDVNHQVRFDADGRPLDVLGLLDPFRLASGLQVEFPDGRPDLYIHNFFFNQVLRVGNFNEARYKAFQLSLVRRLARRWSFQGSYTYSRARGSAEDFQSRLGNDPSTVESEFGYLDFDQRHVVKLNAAVFLPRDWRVGATVTWGSGLPYSVISRFFALDDVRYEQFRTLFGRTVRDPGGAFRFVPERRNSGRNDPVYDVNLQVRRNVVLGRRVAAVSLEIFNLLNTDDLRVFALENVVPDLAGRRLDPTAPAVRGLVIDGERRFGRRFQVGFEMSF